MNQNPDVCALCGQSLRSSTSTDPRFCCAGCERVYQVIQGMSEEQQQNYRRAAEALGLIPAATAIDEEPNQSSNNTLDPSMEREERVMLSGILCRRILSQERI